MDVSPDVLWRVIIHDTFDATDVDSSGGCIRADQPLGSNTRQSPKTHELVITSKNDNRPV